MRQNESEKYTVPAGCPNWVTVELIKKTIKTWQPYYATPLKPDDALEMILNVGNLMVAFKESSCEAICCTSPSQ